VNTLNCQEASKTEIMPPSRGNKAGKSPNRPKNKKAYKTEPMHREIRNKGIEKFTFERHVCCLCQDQKQSFQTREEVIVHLKEMHLAEPSTTNVSVSRVHKCQLCDNEVTRTSLTYHLREYHNLKIVEYAEKHLVSSVTEKELTKERAVAWANQCTYQCKVCVEYKSKCYIKWTSHLKSNHKMSGSEHTKKFGKSLTIKKVHTCKLCQAVILHDRGSLRNHMERRHKSSVFEYFKQYIDGKPLPDEKLLKSEAKKLQLREETTDMQKWGKQSIFTCKICEHSDTCREKLKHHLKRNHDLTQAKYMELHGSLMTVRAIHSCVLCKTELTLRGTHGLKDHILRQHKMSIMTYFTKYIKDKGNVQVRMVPINEQDQKTSCQESEARQWASGITYECNKCKSFKSVHRTKLYQHVHNIHNMTTREYFRAHGKLETSKKHICQVCRLPLTWSFIVLHMHFRMSHSLTVLEYYQKYIKSQLGVKDFSYSKDKAILQEETKKWASGIIFKCKECNKIETNSESNFGVHLKDIHQMTKSQYNEKHGAPVNDKKYHCQLCNRSIVWIYQTLFRHFKIRHNMPLVDYFRKYVQAGNDDHQDSASTHEKKSALKRGMGHNSRRSKLSKASAEDESSESAIDESSDSEDDDWPDESDDDKELNNNSTDDDEELSNVSTDDSSDSSELAKVTGCIYSCQLCQKSNQFNTKTEFELHSVNCHGFSYQKYSRSVASPFHQLTLQQCLHCSKIMISESEVVSQHMTETHGIFQN